MDRLPDEVILSILSCMKSYAKNATATADIQQFWTSSMSHGVSLYRLGS